MTKRSFFSQPKLILNPNYTGSIVIPWRETPSRVQAFKKLTEWYNKNFPSLNIILCDSGSETFNLSASRNVGIKKAFSLDNEFVIVSDADVFSSSDSIIESIESCLKNNSIANPYDHVVNLSYEGTALFFNNNINCISYNLYQASSPTIINGVLSNINPCSGVNVISRAAWELVGEFDENFLGWGFEDNAYHINYIEKYGKPYDFIPGLALFVEHDREWKNNTAGNKEYFKEKYHSEKYYYEGL